MTEVILSLNYVLIYKHSFFTLPSLMSFLTLEQKSVFAITTSLDKFFSSHNVFIQWLLGIKYVNKEVKGK